MCGSFTCSKNTLIGLNVIYIFVSFLMIGVAVHSKHQHIALGLDTILLNNFYPTGKVSGILTSLPIVGGITASGVFLLFISVVGLIGAMKHHQVMLFFYMVVLFFIFIIQFSCSCAALAVYEPDQKVIIKTTWENAEKHAEELIIKTEQGFDCCGIGLYQNSTVYKTPSEEDHKWTLKNKVFFANKYKENFACYTDPKNDSAPLSANCRTCYTKLQPKVCLKNVF